MMLRSFPPLKRPLRCLPSFSRGSPVVPRRLSSTIIADDVQIPPKSEAERKNGSFYISNVFPIKLGEWDPRPALAALQEESIMERLHDIGTDIAGYGFRVESWEIARKDGGVFLHYSYIPPFEEEAVAAPVEDLSSINALPEAIPPSPTSPGRLFLPQLFEAARRHGGLPSWLGQWSINLGERAQENELPGHKVWWTSGSRGLTSKVAEEGKEAAVNGRGSGLSGLQAVAGGGRVWVVKGRQWTEVR
jgi:hypothetical protein